jgi:hypothetical protein
MGCPSGVRGATLMVTTWPATGAAGVKLTFMRTPVRTRTVSGSASSVPTRARTVAVAVVCSTVLASPRPSELTAVAESVPALVEKTTGALVTTCPEGEVTVATISVCPPPDLQQRRRGEERDGALERPSRPGGRFRR